MEVLWSVQANSLLQVWTALCRVFRPGGRIGYGRNLLCQACPLPSLIHNPFYLPHPPQKLSPAGSLTLSFPLSLHLCLSKQSYLPGSFPHNLLNLWATALARKHCLFFVFSLSLNKTYILLGKCILGLLITELEPLGGCWLCYLVNDPKATHCILISHVNTFLNWA